MRKLQLRSASSSQPLPCEVVSLKSEEKFAHAHSIWRARHDAASCDHGFGEHLERLRGLGYACKEQPPAAPPLPSAGPPAAEPDSRPSIKEGAVGNGEPAPEERATSFSSRLLLEGWLGGSVLATSDSSINPGNRILQAPYLEPQLDLRAELKLSNQDTSVVFRPRLEASDSLTHLEFPDERRSKADHRLYVNDLFAQRALGESLQLTAGLFVEGWGPAEFVNPTNPFIHERFPNLDVSYLERGVGLVKALWNPTPHTSLILLAEPVEGYDEGFRFLQSFSPKWSLRGESRSSDATRVGAFTLGQEEDYTWFFGEYALIRAKDSGLSAYFEARHSFSPERFGLVDNGNFTQFSIDRLPGVQSYGVAGVRWEGAVDVRLEYIYYQPGFSQAEWDQAVQAASATSPVASANLGPFLSPGLEFPTRSWWSVSLRRSNFGPRSDWQWISRILAATGDAPWGSPRSGLLISSLEIPAFQNWTFYIQGQVRAGLPDSELLLTQSASIYLGAKASW